MAGAERRAFFLLPALLGLLAGAAAAAEDPAWPKVSDPRSFPRTEAEMERLRGEIDPLVQRLEELRGEFLEKKGFEAYKAERLKVEGELRERFMRYNELRDEYVKVRRNSTMLAFMEAALDARTKRPDSGAIASAITVSHSGRNFGDDAHIYMQRIYQALKDDVEEFASLQELENTRRLWRKVIFGALAVLVISLPFAFSAYRWLFPVREISTAPLRLGEVLQGQYRVERELGSGPMGATYEATDLALRRTVALKRLSEESSRDQRTLDACMAAARAPVAPGAAKIYAFFEEGGRFYLVRELAGNLEAFIREAPKR
ncbi:MAG TPA: hypothetical protein DCM05_06515 [Elusimicrobia bacterium]|nr:hypothetical protein [Elusimicrobiota bacterium]